MPDTGTAFTQDELLTARADDTSDGLIREVLIAFRKSVPPWLQGCLAQIGRMRDLKANWDSYGALPVDPDSLILAEPLLKDLAYVDTLEPPTVTASPAGNVAFCWDDGERSLDLEVRPDGILEYAYLNESQPAYDQEGETQDANALVYLLTRF
jgi:hypothetical protein